MSSTALPEVAQRSETSPARSAMPSTDAGSEFADIEWDGRRVRIEHRWIGRERHDRPLIVFLHEGLGSVAMWKDFPQQLCDAGGFRGLVYSRPGYGASTPRLSDERWQIDYMHRQARELLPALLHALGLDTRGSDKPWLFGHSDGGSIALIHAASFADRVAGLVVVAPHILVEEFGLASIRKARDVYDGELRERLARYHHDVDSAFWGWNRIWLDPAFAAWTIEADLPRIVCPVLAVQGRDDEYGTIEQIRGIARRVTDCRLVELADCGHAAHRDQPARLIDETIRFIADHGDKP